VRIEPPPADAVDALVAMALREDRAFDDITSLATVGPTLEGTGRFVARERGVMAGGPVVEAVCAALDRRVRVERLVEDGVEFGVGDTVLVARGPVRPMLQGERVALNFLQRLCAIATLTGAYVAAVEGTGVTILDTRKTTPGLRLLEKYAVRCGGGTNHRGDLAAMAMIKDNHREALARGEATLAEGIARIREGSPAAPVEVEIDELEDLEAALAGKPEWILLDNMEPEQVRRAVQATQGRAKIEVSGGVTLATVRALAEAGPDAISVGALTHSAGALDIGLDLEF
jgi:nicotinate-nucleotide pyrophosphorylase (carboxylating)